MKLGSKFLIFSGATLVVGSLGFIAYKQFEISQRQLAIETQVVKQLELVNGIMRSQHEYATRGDVEKFIKDQGVNLNAIKSNLDKLHAEVSAVNAVSFKSIGYQASNLPSTSTGVANPNKPPTVTCNGEEINCNFDPYKYYSAQQNMSLFEPFQDGTKIPIGEVGFSAWQQNPWEVYIKPREYYLTTVVGTDENQRTYFYNKISIKTDNKTYDIRIDKAETKQVYPEAKFSFWNPRLYLGTAGGINLGTSSPEANLNVQLTFSSYGKFKSQPDFTVLGLGAAYQFGTKTSAVMLTPFSYNIGKHLPLMENTYIGPSVTLDTKGNFSAMAGISVGL